MSNETEPPSSPDSTTTTPEPTTTPTPEPTQDQSSLITDPPAAPAEPAPSAFDVTELTFDNFKALLPQDAEVNEPLARDFLKLLNESKSRSDLAKSMVDLQTKVVTQAQEQMAASWNTTQEGWKAEIQNDPVIGGSNLAANLAEAQTVINTYAADAAALKQLFGLTGMGNNIHMLRFLMNVAKAIPGEGKPVQGTTEPEGKTRAERLFTNS